MADIALRHADDAGGPVSAESFASFYEEFAPRVRALATRRLRNRDLADDVVQETLLRCYRARDRFDDARPAWPWVKTIATNVCIDLQREGAGWRELPAGISALEPSAPADNHSDPAQVFISRERRECINLAMGALSPRQRRVVVLRDVEGWRANDVATMEGSSTDAVKAALKRGRQVFRLAYTDAAGPRGLLAPLVVLGTAWRLMRAKVKATSSATGAKVQLVSMTSLVVATGVATIAVVGVQNLPAGAANDVSIPRPTTVAAVKLDGADATVQSAGPARPVVAVEQKRAVTTPAEVSTEEVRHEISAPVPGVEPLLVAEVFVATPCAASDTRRSLCDTAMTVSATATVESPSPPTPPVG